MVKKAAGKELAASSKKNWGRGNQKKDDLEILQNKLDALKRPITTKDCVEILNISLENYEKEHPHWHLEVLVSLIKWALRNLKHFIEEKREKTINWSNPFVELHYPVDWDWKSPRNGDTLHGKQILGKFPEGRIRNAKTLINALTGMMAAKFNVMALNHFTNGTWFEKRHNKYIPYLSAEYISIIEEFKDKQKQHEAAQEFFRPFSIGATRVDLSTINLKKPARISKEINKQLQSANQRMDIPGVSFDGNINGKKIWAGLIFEIHPLLIDSDSEKAYHPITIGLAFEHKLSGTNLVSTNPSRWPRKDQNLFWTELLESLSKLTQELIPKKEILASIIMKDNEGLQITRIISDPKDLEDAKKWMTAQDKAEGEKNQKTENLRQLLKTNNDARTSDEKGRALEELVAELFRSVAGLSIEDKRVKTESEEIDLTISNGSDDPKLKREEAIILVECKNWSTKCGKNEFVEFRNKMENRKGRCSLGFLISWNGFADTITKEMLRDSHERLLIVPIDGKQIQEAIRDNSFFGVIISAWNKAIMI